MPTGVRRAAAVAAHEVDAGEKFVGGKHTVEGFAGDAGELRRPRAGGHERRLDTHFPINWGW